MMKCAFNAYHKTAHKFAYDAFGEMRSTSGQLANSNNSGGDFRFQGQWLESATGIYHFRARDYDSKTGTFLSRDPVDPTEQQPEAMNPYQAMYNNPYVYSDPTGMFTLIELNAADSLRNVLEYGRSYMASAARDFIREKTGEIFGNILMGVLNSLLPGTAEGGAITGLAQNAADLAGQRFENFLTGQICAVLRGSSFSERLWITPEVATSGVPHSNGLNCEGYLTPTALAPLSPRYPNPDFLFKQGRPTDYQARNPDAYLIGDVKLSMTKAISDITGNETQWQAIYRHARRFQALPFTGYVSFRMNAAGERLASRVQMAQREAIRRNVVLFLLNISD